MTPEEIRERVVSFFRERDKETETLTEWAKALVKHMEEKIGFTRFHLHIQKVLKSFIGMDGGIRNREEWATVCSTITDNEKHWLTAIAIYLSPEQIQENEQHNSI